jgi:hypothetical protein
VSTPCGYRNLRDRQRGRGNAEGTPTRARTSTPGHSSSADSSDFRAFFGRRDPRLPAVPASLLDGKEGVSGSSPEEGFPAKQAFSPLLLPAFARRSVHFRSTSLLYELLGGLLRPASQFFDDCHISAEKRFDRVPHQLRDFGGVASLGEKQ